MLQRRQRGRFQVRGDWEEVSDHMSDIALLIVVNGHGTWGTQFLQPITAQLEAFAQTVIVHHRCR
ncbi:hypothetical protein D3C85_1890240 [compost metagenome]